MQRPITRGAAADAGLIFHIFAQDSTSTTGAGKASVAFGSWTCRYIRSGEAISGAITPEDITTIGTYAAPTANTNIRIKAVDNTNMIGVYEIQLHLDWVNVTNNCQSLTIYLTATGVAVLPIQIPLYVLDTQLLQATAASVNAQVLDVLDVDTFAQPGQSTPAATTSIRLMVAWLYKAWRNHTFQNATEYRLYNDNTTTVDQKATVTIVANTSVDRTEVETGP